MFSFPSHPDLAVAFGLLDKYGAIPEIAFFGTICLLTFEILRIKLFFMRRVGVTQPFQIGARAESPTVARIAPAARRGLLGRHSGLVGYLRG